MGHTRGGVGIGGKRGAEPPSEWVRRVWRRRRGGGVGWLPDVVKRVGTSLGILVRISITGGGESVSVEEQACFLLGPITS